MNGGENKSDVENFNPRPREEGDLLIVFASGVASDFNPRPREEGDGKFIQ